MSLWVAPGASFEATVQGFTSGLVGAIGVRILDNVGGTTSARTTAGIIEFPAGSGHYAATLTAPDVAGSYTVFWDTGVVSPSTTAAEDLTVTTTTPGGAVAQPGDLTTLEAVRSFLQKGGSETAQDAEIQRQITAASRAIMLWAGREFAPAAGPLTRSFTYWGGPMLSLTPYDLRSATSVVIDADGDNPTTLTAATDYVFQPLNGAGGAYDAIWFTSTRPRASVTPRRVDVTGLWGFASVPSDVEHACIVTVAVWMRRDVSAFTATFVLDEARVERPEALPSSVKGMLQPYRRMAIA